MKKGLKSLFPINPTKNLKSYVQACTTLLNNFKSRGSLAEAQVLHGHLLKMGLPSERFIAVKLLLIYLNFRKSKEVDLIVKEFGGFDLVFYNCLIHGYVKWGDIDNARKLFDEMPERNEVSWTALVSGLMKHGRVRESMLYFRRNPFRNVVSWTAAISGMVQNGLNFDALKLFREMLQHGVMPNDVSFTSVVKACGELGDYGLAMSLFGLILKTGFGDNLSVCNSLITLSLKLGKGYIAERIFNGMEERDVVSWTAILDMYAQSGDLGEARHIFDKMPWRNEVSWSAMITRYNQSGFAEEAVKLFWQMVQEGVSPTISCFSSVISALASLRALQVGMSIHARVVRVGLERDIYTSSSLIDLYCKCGRIEAGRLVFDLTEDKNVVSWNSMVSGYSLNGNFAEAKELFEHMPEKNKVSWNAMIAGFLENGLCDEVFEIFHQMILSGEMPNDTTFSSVLGACASTASLETGKNLHGKIIKLGIQYNTFVATALVDTYAKCGDLESSSLLFERMPEKNEVSWTAMIQGLAENGFAEDAILLFEQMERSSCVSPNEVMLVAVLFACSHCGLVDKGLWYFNSLESVYGIKPKSRHYTCIIDLLSRSGRLSEAEKFINSMPFTPDTNAWAALLSGCSKYKNKDIAERAARRISELSEKSPAGYILLSNIYASAGRWIDVVNTRKLMKDKGLKKSGGFSWVEVRKKLHYFYSEDGSHTQSGGIYQTLELLRYEMLDHFECPSECS